MRRRLLFVLLVVAVALGALFVIAPWSSDDDGPRAGSDDLGTGSPLELRDVPVAYQITYRVQDGSSATAERLTVQRPFDSRLETWTGSRPAGEPATTEIASFGRTSRTTAEGQRLAVAVPPGLASADVRLDGVLDRAVEQGVLDAREQRRVIGRTCQVYRTGQSLRLVELKAPTATAFVDVCIDDSGLVLEEVDGARRRIATDLDLSPEITDETFDVGDRTVSVSQGGGVVAEMSENSRPPSAFFELGDDLPLDRIGRYAIVPPQPEAFTDPMQRGRRVAGLADVLAEGPDVITVERGGSLGGGDVIGPLEGATEVDLGELGTGKLVLTSGGGELSVAQGRGRYVRVSGTVSVAELTAVARGLHEVDGGTLTPVGESW